MESIQRRSPYPQKDRSLEQSRGQDHKQKSNKQDNKPQRRAEHETDLKVWYRVHLSKHLKTPNSNSIALL